MATMYIQNNYIYISAMILNEETGKNVRKKKSTKLKDTRANRKHVEERLLPRFEKELREGKITLPSKVYTVQELGKIYLEQKRLDSTRSYTAHTYQKALELHVYPRFGDKLPENITTADINQWQIYLLNTRSIGRVKNIKIPFNQIFELAINKELVEKNPFTTALKISRNKDIKRQSNIATQLKSLVGEGSKANDIVRKIKAENENKKNPFSELEIKTLIKNATGMLRNWIELAFYTGMRPSEQLGLLWSQVNFEEKYLLVVGAITGHETEEERYCNKSLSSVRVIHLCDKAIEVLKKQYEDTKDSDYNHVFLNQYSKPYTSLKSIREKRFKKLLKNINLESHRIYDIRHSFASINLSKGRLPIVLISEIMGHKDPSVTLKMYSSYISDSKEEIFTAMNQAFKDF